MAIPATLVAKYVTLADKNTKGLQAAVTHRVWTGQLITGEPTYGARITRRAIVERRVQKIRLADGQMIDSRAYVAFIGPVKVSPKDEIVLSDGTTGPILRILGLENAATGDGFTVEVWLG